MKLILILEYALYLVSFCDARFEEPLLNQHSLIWQGIGILLLIQAIIGCIFRFKPDGRRILVPYIFKYMGFILIWMLLIFFNSGTEIDEYVILIGFIVTVFLFGLLLARYNAVKEMIAEGFIIPNIMLIINDGINQINVFDFLKQVNLSSFFSSVYSQRVRFSLGFPNPNTLGNLVTCLLCVSFPLLAILKKSQGGGTTILRIIVVALDLFDLITLIDCGSRTGMACFLICLFVLVFLLSTNSNIHSSKTRKVVRTLSMFFIIATLGLFFFDRIFSSYVNGRHESFELLTKLKGIQYILGRGVFPPGAVISQGTHLDNYYVYLILTTGLIGLFLFLLLFGNIFKDICAKGNNSITYGIIGCFVADMLYGFGETCVLYPMFPSAAVFIVLFISYSIAGVNESISDQ